MVNEKKIDLKFLTQFEHLQKEYLEVERKREKLQTELEKLESEGTVKDTVSGGNGGKQHFVVEGVPMAMYSRKKTMLYKRIMTAEKLEEKINQDKQLLEELKAKREVLEVEALRKFLHDNGMTTEEIIAGLTAASPVVHEQKIGMEDRKNVEL